MALKARTLNAAEAQELKRLADSHTAPHRVVQRAQIMWASGQGETVRLIALQVGLLAFGV
jgi:hypothetical protein